MPYTSTSLTGQTTYVATHEPRDGSTPYPPSSASQSFTSRRESRTGTNSPYTKGGFIVTPIRVAVPYRAVISYQMVPTRRYRKIYDRRTGRWRRDYYIVYRKKKIWGHKVRVSTKIVKSPLLPHIVLKPNQLDYSAYTVENKSPLQLSAVVTSPGSQFGSAAYINGIGMSSPRFNAIYGSSLGSNPNLSGYADYPTVEADLSREALSKLYTRTAEGHANLQNMLAEANKTIGLADNILSSFLSLYRSLRKLDVKMSLARAKNLKDQVRRIGKEASGLWLSWVYGVSPLMSDLESISRSFSESQTWRTYSASASRSIPQAGVANLQAVKETSLSVVDITVKWQATMSCSCSVPSFLSRHGFLTPEATIWEVIPFSFIIDWFYPVGAYLSSSKVFNYNFMFGHRTVITRVRRRVERSYGYVHTSSYPNYVVSGPSQVASSEGIRVTRSVQNTIPSMPRPQVDLLGLTSGRALNAIALILAR